NRYSVGCVLHILSINSQWIGVHCPGQKFEYILPYDHSPLDRAIVADDSLRIDEYSGYSLVHTTSRRPASSMRSSSGTATAHAASTRACFAFRQISASTSFGNGTYHGNMDLTAVLLGRRASAEY